MYNYIGQLCTVLDMFELTLCLSYVGQKKIMKNTSIPTCELYVRVCLILRWKKINLLHTRCCEMSGMYAVVVRLYTSLSGELFSVRKPITRAYWKESDAYLSPKQEAAPEWQLGKEMPSIRASLAARLNLSRFESIRRTREGSWVELSCLGLSYSSQVGLVVCREN